ncbi:unnamed protein product, partial [Vitis vinifera]|uniref:Uncharacterized protein n=1 Tax=Vitis vinifera TaxID=29760 RepID=D7T5J7_VITVI
MFLLVSNHSIFNTWHIFHIMMRVQNDVIPRHVKLPNCHVKGGAWKLRCCVSFSSTSPLLHHSSDSIMKLTTIKNWTATTVESLVVYKQKCKSWIVS